MILWSTLLEAWINYKSPVHTDKAIDSEEKGSLMRLMVPNVRFSLEGNNLKLKLEKRWNDDAD